jgi:hypothetical protein
MINSTYRVKKRFDKLNGVLDNKEVNKICTGTSYNGSTRGWGSCSEGSIPSVPTDKKTSAKLFSGCFCNKTKLSLKFYFFIEHSFYYFNRHQI